MKAASEYSQDELRVLKWYDGLRETTNAAFLPLFFSKTHWLVMMGGGGSGKSWAAARIVVERCMTEPGHRFLVVRQVFDTLRDSCFALLKETIERHYPGCGAKCTVSPMRIEFPNGSMILFKGLDDVEKVKSIYHITSIWIEEASECSERDVDQLDIRLRDESPYLKQIIVTFNPVSVRHWLKARFFDKADPDVTVSRTTYKDNRFLPPEEGAKLESFRERDPYYYAVYCLGEWGVLGQSVFPALEVTERLNAIRGETFRRGEFIFERADERSVPRKAELSESGDGCVKIFREYEPGRVYVIGADTAGEGSDAFAAHVVDAQTGEQCAVLRIVNGEDAFNEQLYCLGRLYGDALIAPEVNFSTYCVNTLRGWKYPRLYVREVEDTYTGKHKKAYGFVTTNKTRPRIIAELVRDLTGHMDLIHDDVTLDEMLTFVRNDDYRPEAEEGAHDDMIMALAIAHHACEQAPAAKVQRTKAKWRKDQYEDYRNASAEDKAMLIERWGDPF